MDKKIILVLVIILIVLILITSFISNFFKNKKPATEIKNVIPTAIVNYNSNQNKLNPTEKAKQLIVDKIISQIKIFPKADLETLSKLNKTLPFKSDDFDVEYSPFLNQYFVSKKTPDADKKIALWAANNGLSELIKNENLFIFTDQPVTEYRKKIEETVLQNNHPPGVLITPTSIVPTIESASTQDLSITPEIDPMDYALTKLFNDLYFSGTKIASPEAYNPLSTPSPQSTSHPSSQITAPLGQYSPVPPLLADIFNEAGQKVGVPPKILEAIMRNECDSPFYYSPEEITLYSQPGGKIPTCLINNCAAAGPMQITTMYDYKGSSSCSDCGEGVTACPNTWASIGDAVNRFGGYVRDPNPWNLKDSVYASAYFLKSVTGAANSTNWTKDQVFTAMESYFGDDSCTENADTHRIERYSFRTYCEYVWDYYTTR